MSTSFPNRAGLAPAEQCETADMIAAPAKWQRSVKRVIDIFGATAGLIFLSPLLLVIAALVKLHDGG
ncbi:MAG TPA: hypothetical protein VGU90_06250, partial [Terriglobales bacterium]|nr:hypothetical protein [Terriglobales bacterium]